MVTYRLIDAMPASRRHEWEVLSAIEDQKERRTKLEAYLDRGYGSCHLRASNIANLVEQNLIHFDGQRYRLMAWVIMPNHVHLLFEMWETPLSTLLKSWKAYTASKANELLGRRGAFWQAEYWDRFIRDEEHFNRARHYIEWNPVKAGLVREPAQWTFCSANPRWPWNATGSQARYLSAHLMHVNWNDRSADGHVRELEKEQRPAE